jgi:hypothetical protein
MKIVCIAWGSLLWRPGELDLASNWTQGGPALPLEFARDSDDSDELALVLCEGATPVPTYIAEMATSDIGEAKAQLRVREKLSPDRPEWIASMRAGDDARDGVPAAVALWLTRHAFDAAIWTAIPPKFHGQNGRVPSEDEALEYLAALTGKAQTNAEDYIRRIPAEIMTPYRARFGQHLGWTPLPMPA